MKLQPECVSQIAEIIFQTRSNVQTKTMYQERRWRNEEGSNFRTCRYSSIGFRCVWKKCCNGKQFRFGCFNGIGILAGGKWTESNPCEPGNKFVSGVTEEYPVRWGEQLGQDPVTSFLPAGPPDRREAEQQPPRVVTPRRLRRIRRLHQHAVPRIRRHEPPACNLAKPRPLSDRP